jgi:hypothetical protein
VKASIALRDISSKSNIAIIRIKAELHGRDTPGPSYGPSKDRKGQSKAHSQKSEQYNYAFIDKFTQRKLHKLMESYNVRFVEFIVTKRSEMKQGALGLSLRLSDLEERLCQADLINAVISDTTKMDHAHTWNTHCIGVGSLQLK